MPTYVYKREDGTTFEIKQRITEDPLETCPETGQDVERIITGNAGLIFKGDGFYVNDYGDGSGGSSSPSSSDASSGDDAADEPSGSGTDASESA
jgi:putative FmdB family regulatory protein